MSTQTVLRNLRGYLISFVITLIIIELLCMIFISTGYIPGRIPSYRMPDPSRRLFADINEDFGVWHDPNMEFRHVTACFDVTIRSNAFGMIDGLVEKTGDTSRTVVIGDSYVEGVGVEYGGRFTELLEDQVGRPFLNFGSSGGVGSTQYMLMYRTMAREFAHDEVMVFILPYNDFHDDVPIKGFYRPYLAGEYPGYSLEYTLEDISESRLSDGKRSKRDLTTVMREFSYAWNAGDYMTSVLEYRARQNRTNDKSNEPYSGYNDYTPEEMLRMRYALEQIRQDAAGKRMMVVSIPRLQDMHRYEDNGENRFGEEMSVIATEVGFDYLDLMPSMVMKKQGELNALFHPCDGHWSLKGHRLAAEVLQTFWQGK